MVDDIQTVEKQNELFHNGDRSTVVTTIEADKKVRAMMGGSPHLVRSLVQMDNPDHFAYRRLTQAWFLPQNLRGLEARIREIARGFVDRMAARGDRCDFARDVAFLYPLHDAPHDYRRYTAPGLESAIRRAGLDPASPTPRNGGCESAALLGAIACAEAALGAWRSRSWRSIFAPLALVAIPCINLTGWIGAKLYGGGRLLASGHSIEARKSS